MLHRNISAKAVMKEFQSAGITQVLCIFPDIRGQPRSLQVSIGILPRVFKRGVGVDGSSLDGIARIEESDLRAIPDPRTARVLPWKIADEPTGIVVCDIVRPSGRPFMGDPRYTLRRVLSETDRKDWIVNAGAELEFFLFSNGSSPTPLDRGGYYALTEDRQGLDLRTQMMSALRKLGIEEEIGHHEVGPSQQEIDMNYAPALVMADSILLARWVIKLIAQQHDLIATFMPKPLSDENGSGMHIHMSITDRAGENLFFARHNGQRHHYLSVFGRRFLAGLLKYVPELTLVFNQWENSYKRLIPGYEAPVYVCWGSRNRSALVRRPDYEPGHEVATRLELRSPDPACNPYLALACMLRAGLTGVAQKLRPPPPVEKDAYTLTPRERTQLQLGSLPVDFAHAIELFSSSDLALKVLGRSTFATFLRNKQTELTNWRRAVTDYELKRRLRTL
ncbi:glutamine synthetase family protein [Patescibacteria group bacterium]|nr:glutamine synthetase family protein [Patescibacteria group bacterium]MBU1891091.1 glutamine synthetase family protein [Patescibacteria group bacterium]